MLDETLSVVSLWTSVNSWFTPFVLFVVLNLVIGTIAFTSSKPPTASNNPHAPQPLPRSPSVLHRLRSLHLCRSEIPPPSSDSVFQHSAPDPDPETVIRLKRENAVPETATEELVESGESVIPEEEEEEEIEEDVEGLEGPTMEQVFSQIQKGAGVYGRSKSDGGQVMAPKKVRKRTIQKAASDISSVTGQFTPPAVAEDEEEGKERADGEEVDGKAEDFINRFRKQLNLQRMESLYRANA